MRRSKRFKVFIGVFLIILLSIGCKKEEPKSEPATAPLLSTTRVSAIKVTSATCGGNISNDGGKPIITRGICWSTKFNPSITDSLTNDGDGVGTYISDMTNLLPDTTYYVRAYATNSIGTSYGNQFSFKTFNYPKATISNIRVVSNSSIFFDFYLSYYDPNYISEIGICWNTNINPTTENNHLKFSTINYFRDTIISKFANNTTYYIRAYVKGEGWIGYSDELTFTTYNWNTGSVTDIDNNTYKTIQIGTQEWMQENLKVTHYGNGDVIDNIVDNKTWANLSTGAMCWYDNDEVKYKNTYGALYNWYAVVDSRNVCPTGWHTPSNDEWIVLFDFLGGSKIAGSKMKATNWTFQTTNISGFTGVPCGYRIGSSGIYSGISVIEYLWFSGEIELSPSRIITGGPVIMQLYDDISFMIVQKSEGMSVRCIKD